MSLPVMSLILIGGFMLLLALGTEIAVAMGVIATLGLTLFVGRPLIAFVSTAFDLMNSFTFTAVPLFVFMGAVFAETGVIRTLFTGANRLVGGLPGGVACSVIGANAIFGAISGSSVAATATFGKFAYPEMERLQYSPKLSLGSIAVGGTLSVLIPPSIILLVYGGWESVSVARLFAGGMIPGIILASLLMVTAIAWVKIFPGSAPKPPQITFKERLLAIRDILPFLVVIAITLGVIFGGIMTPTEAASMGAFLGLVMALIYRKLTYKALKNSMLTALKVTAMMAFILFAANVLAQVFQYIGLTEKFGKIMLALPFGKYGVFAIICVMYLVLGCFLESLSMLTITLPFVSPLMFQLGFSPVWFGVVYVVLAEVGLVTPPFGLNLFVLNSVVPKHSVMEVALGSFPFLLAFAIEIVLLTAFPQLVLWLPAALYD